MTTSRSEKEFEFVITERMRLRRFDRQVIDHIHRNYDDKMLMEFYGFNSVEALQKEKDRFSSGHSTFNRTMCYFHLLNKKDDRVIGWCGYHTWATDHDRAELGYVISDKSNMGKGIMTEALEAVLKYGFRELGLHRVEALTGKDNKASLRLLEKFGFSFEGTLRQHYKVKGINEDSLMFSLLKPEFLKTG